MGSAALSEVKKEETVALFGKNIGNRQSVFSGVHVGESEKFPSKDGGVIYETQVIVPADDLLGHPTAFLVKSRNPLGNLKDKITIAVQIQSRYYFDNNDKKRFNNNLWVIED